MIKPSRWFYFAVKKNTLLMLIFIIKTPNCCFHDILEQINK